MADWTSETRKISIAIQADITVNSISTDDGSPRARMAGISSTMEIVTSGLAFKSKATGSITVSKKISSIIRGPISGIRSRAVTC